MKYKAIIVGCGRMGVGGPEWKFPYVYTHADTYKALGNRVQLVGAVEADETKAVWAGHTLGLPVYTKLEAALEVFKPDIVSVCTPNGTHVDVLSKLQGSKVKGVWLEKPCELTSVPEIPVQVNYCRRFCYMNRMAREAIFDLEASLYVWARKDWTTIVHFADLARWLGIPKERVTYVDNTGEHPSTNSYRIEAGKWAFDFRNGGCQGGFMENALTGLINTIDHGDDLLSPVASAIESEKLAREMLNGSQ